MHSLPFSSTVLATALYAVFLLLGFGISQRLLTAQRLLIRLWAGGLIGHMGLMVLPVPFAFFLGFGLVAHGAALLVMLALFAVCFLFGEQVQASNEGASRDDIWFAAIAAALGTLFASLYYTHILLPGADGALYVGQATFGDLSMHLGMITSLAAQGTFPPTYSIFPGHRLSYPFFINALSSSLYLFGMPLRWAVILPSVVLTYLLILGFEILAFSILGKRHAVWIATALFFFNGGLGVWYFLDGVSADPHIFTRMFTDFYHTPTNFNEHNIRWSNVICDMILPQRTTMAGWAFALFAFWLLREAIQQQSRRYFALAGIVVGLMPMIHTHSFLALGVVSVAWFFCDAWPDRSRQTRFLINWLTYAVIAATLAFPQLFFWTFRQVSEGSFLRLFVGWIINGDNWLWFWIKNVGLVFILLLPALLWSRRTMWSFYTGAAALFIIANIWVFQPNEYDNNKLFYIWYMFSCIVVGGFIDAMILRLPRFARPIALGGLLLVATISGLLTIGREIHSSYRLFAPDDVEASRFIINNTPPDALFITSDNHNNAVAALTGRNILSGSQVFLFFHGINTGDRDRDIKSIFTDPAGTRLLQQKWNVDYAYLSSYERDHFNIDGTAFDSAFPKIFEQGDVKIYALSDRARHLSGD